MKCPDCGSSLTGVDFGGIEKAYRCFLCGGVWLRGRGNDGLPEKAILHWNTVRVDPAMLRFGGNLCPVDGEKLAEIKRPELKGMPVRQCVKCRWWWFPTDSLFLYDPSGGRGVNFEAMWKTVGALVFAGALIVGTGVSVRMVINRQQVKINAAGEVRNYSYTYLGNGQVRISFESNEEMFSVPYRTATGRWEYAATQHEGGVYMLSIDNLEENTVYELRLGEESYFFKTRI